MNEMISVVQTTLPGEWLEAEVGEWTFSIINEKIVLNDPLPIKIHLY